MSKASLLSGTVKSSLAMMHGAFEAGYSSLRRTSSGLHAARRSAKRGTSPQL